MQTEPDIESIKVQYEMDRLKRMDNQNRLRTAKYLQKKQQEGRRQISAMISESTYQEICKIKDNSIDEPLTTGDVIERGVDALNFLTSKRMETKHNEIINTVAVNIDNDIEAMLNHAKGLWTGKESKEYTAYLREMIFQLNKSGISSNKIKALFEAQGVKTAKGKDIWSKGTIDNINIQQKRLNSDAGE